MGCLLKRCVPHLLACTILLSCAAKPKPLEINVEVQPGYKGTLHITPCSNHPGRMQADQQGQAYVAQCPYPGQEIELVVVQGTTTYRIPSSRLRVSKTGDGIPVEVIASIE